MESMPNNTVQYEVDHAVATMLLDRPESLNSMTNDFMDDIAHAVALANGDDDVRVLVVTGAGRGFCSGADLSDVSSPDEGAEAGVTDGMNDHFNPAILALKNCAVPTVARVNGAAAGGGLGLALTCDIAIAARSAFFVATFGPRLGIVPDLGSTWSLPGRVGRARAMGMAMLGDRISAEQAEDWGLIWKTVDDDQLDAEVTRATDILRATSPAAMQRIRSSLDTASMRSFGDQLDLERDHQEVLIPLNMVEGASAFMDKREPKFEA